MVGGSSSRAGFTALLLRLGVFSPLMLQSLLGKYNYVFTVSPANSHQRAPSAQ